MDPLQGRYDRLRELLARTGPVAVAFSGGVDSTLLLRVARDVLGDGVMALTVDTALSPRREMAEAERLADRLGVRHERVGCDVLQLPLVAGNGPERCYHCKTALFRLLLERAAASGFTVLADGSNRDDLADYRPGRRALQELGIVSPLLEAGFTKAEVRQLSRRLGLSTWDKPAAACLASRIPCGTPLTRERLGQVEQGEEVVLGLGIRGGRVRHHGEVARIEVSEADIPRLCEAGLGQALVDGLTAVGFRFVTLDLAGYRTGSMNLPRKDGLATNEHE
jgi:uncharacterized protein